MSLLKRLVKVKGTRQDIKILGGVKFKMYDFLTEKFRDCDIVFSLFISGSRGRNENSNLSDYDFIVVVKDFNDALSMRKFLCFRFCDTLNEKVSFIICLEHYFLRNINNLYVLSIDKSFVLFDKLNLANRVGIKSITELEVLKYNLQSASYYISKYFYTRNEMWWVKGCHFLYKYILNDKVNYLKINSFCFDDVICTNNIATYIKNEYLVSKNKLEFLRHVVNNINLKHLMLSSSLFSSFIYEGRQPNFTNISNIIFLENQGLIKSISFNNFGG